jgi:nitrate reductase NapE component
LFGKSKNRKRAAEHFKNFSQPLRLLINVNRNAALQRKEIEIATFLPIAVGKFCLLSYWLVEGIFCGISQRLSFTL